LAIVLIGSIRFAERSLSPSRQGHSAMNGSRPSENIDPGQGPAQATAPQAASKAGPVRRRNIAVIPTLVVLATVAAVAALWLWYPARPLVTITPPEDATPWSFSAEGRTLLTQAQRGHELVPPVRFWSTNTGNELPAPFPESTSCKYAFF